MKTVKNVRDIRPGEIIHPYEGGPQVVVTRTDTHIPTGQTALAGKIISGPKRGAFENYVYTSDTNMEVEIPGDPEAALIMTKAVEWVRRQASIEDTPVMMLAHFQIYAEKLNSGEIGR